jgi:hypothetical protein
MDSFYRSYNLYVDENIIGLIKSSTVMSDEAAIARSEELEPDSQSQ